MRIIQIVLFFMEHPEVIDLDDLAASDNHIIQGAIFGKTGKLVSCYEIEQAKQLVRIRAKQEALAR